MNASNRNNHTYNTQWGGNDEKVARLLSGVRATFTNLRTSAAERFDYKLFEDLDGYKYDKFDKTWSYYQAYLEEFSDANVVIGISISGDSASISLPILYAKIMKPTGEPFHTVKSLDFLVDDRVFTFENVYEGDSESLVYLGSSGQYLVEELAKATIVSVRLGLGFSSITIDIPAKDYQDTIKVISETLVKYDVWQFYTDKEFLKKVDTIFPLTISD